MKSGLLLALLASMPGCAHALQTTDEANSMLFLQSVSMEKRAIVCTSRAPDLSEQFQTALSGWRARNAKAIAQGEAFMREDSKRNNIAFESSVAQVTTIDAQLLEQAPAELSRHNCAKFIEAMNNG